MRSFTRVGTLVSSVALTMLIGSGTGRSATAAQIAAAPAFKARDLTMPPRTDWVTNGGNVFNQRYSPLTQLNRANVKDLKALWRTSMGSGANPNNSGQAQILQYEGTLYVINGANDVFALDVETGAIRWTYHGNPDPKAGVPMGKSSRGVAMGEGKIFVGQLDAKLVALDQRTGKVVWSIEAEPWQKGFSITSAPLYYDGMVITGFSGGEMASRGRVKAFRAKDGKLLWQFNTVPAPGEFGHDTWPQDSNAWELGGAPVWQTPAVDPELDLVYFSTGNPGPDLHGGVRPGDNLFSVSIVAVEAHTGKYRWHFQQVHHDIWDYDSPNPVVLFDAPFNGVMRKAHRRGLEDGLGVHPRSRDRQAADRHRGAAGGAGAASGDRRHAALSGRRRDRAAVDRHPARGLEHRARRRHGGERRQDLHAVLDRADRDEARHDGRRELAAELVRPRDASSVRVRDRSHQLVQRAVGAALEGRAERRLHGRAFRAGRGRRSRHPRRARRHDEQARVAPAVARDLLQRLGRHGGRLAVRRPQRRSPHRARQVATAELLWEFRTDAGVNTTVTTFDWHGDQRVVVHAGGGVFAGAPRGDGIWMFSLQGTMKSLPVGGATSGGPGGFGGPGRPQAPAAERPISADHGRQLYAEACVACHGEHGDGGHGGGPTLIAGLPTDTIVAVANTGRNNMPPFGRVYSEPDLRDIATYVVDVLGKPPK